MKSRKEWKEIFFGLPWALFLIMNLLRGNIPPGSEAFKIFFERRAVGPV